MTRKYLDEDKVRISIYGNEMALLGNGILAFVDEQGKLYNAFSSPYAYNNLVEGIIEKAGYSYNFKYRIIKDNDYFNKQ